MVARLALLALVGIRTSVLAATSAKAAREAADAIADAAADAARPLPRAAFGLLMQAVTANADAAMRAKGWSPAAIQRQWGMGHVGTETEQQVLYAERLRSTRPKPSAICEVGFNAGHSAALFLALTAPQVAPAHLDLASD